MNVKCFWNLSVQMTVIEKVSFIYKLHMDFTKYHDQNFKKNYKN